jgi:hypothetical protein
MCDVHDRLPILCDEDDRRAEAMFGGGACRAQTLRLLFFHWMLRLPLAIVGMEGVTLWW